MTEGPVWRFTTLAVSRNGPWPEGGTFMMGDEFGDLWFHCRPVHEVTHTTSEIGKYEVTFDQYDTFCEATGRSKPGDSGWGRDGDL